MKKQYGWVSEYQQRKFFESREAIRERKLARKSLDVVGVKEESKLIVTKSDYENLDNNKTIAVMLDLEGTVDYLDDSKAKIFINQLDLLRKKFGAKKGIISISTFSTHPQKIKEAFDILSPHLIDSIEIGTSFYYSGVYDYAKDMGTFKEYGFNLDKVKTFTSYYVNNSEVCNQWFALIDDTIPDYVYKEYQNRHPMLVLRPSQRETGNLKNNFMSISTTTQGFDGVIEGLNTYIESIRDFTPSQILETQKNMITYLSRHELIRKFWNREYAFLERYFSEGFADESNYNDMLDNLIYIDELQGLSMEELLHIREILRFVVQYFDETQNIESSLKLQRTLDSVVKKQNMETALRLQRTLGH